MTPPVKPEPKFVSVFFCAKVPAAWGSNFKFEGILAHHVLGGGIAGPQQVLSVGPMKPHEIVEAFNQIVGRGIAQVAITCDEDDPDVERVQGFEIVTQEGVPTATKFVEVPDGARFRIAPEPKSLLVTASGEPH